MASVCDVCGKGPGFGHNVSHSHRRTNRRWNPNIQTVRVAAGGGNTKRLQVCTSCIKAGKVSPRLSGLRLPSQIQTPNETQSRLSRGSSRKLVIRR